MREEEIRHLYDAGYAKAYDERFLTGPPWARQGAEFEVELLGELLHRPDARWLDVACGTGWFLSHFPDVERIGLDLSPSMVDLAGIAAPGATIVEGSYLDPHPEWDDLWPVVSCMWFAYAYVETVDAVERVMANLARWTAPDGTCFVPVCDLVDLTGGTSVPYRNDDTWTFGGPLRVVASVWSWTDLEHGKDHRNLVCPHLDHVVLTLGRWFEEVEVVHYPPFQPGWGGRRALVGRRKRSAEGEGPTLVVRERREPYRPTPEDVAAAEAAQAEAARADVEAMAGPSPADLTSTDENGAAPAGSADGPPSGSPIPESRRHGVWRAWWALPVPARHGLRATWRLLPRAIRQRTWPDPGQTEAADATGPVGHGTPMGHR